MFSYMIFVILLTFCWHFQLKIWHLHRMWCRWQISGKHAFFKKLWTKLYTSFSKVVFTKYFVCTFTIVPNTFLYFSMVTPSMVTLTIFKMGHMLWDHKGRTVGRWHLWVQTVHLLADDKKNALSLPTRDLKIQLHGSHNFTGCKANRDGQISQDDFRSDISIISIIWFI